MHYLCHTRRCRIPSLKDQSNCAFRHDALQAMPLSPDPACNFELPPTPSMVVTGLDLTKFVTFVDFFGLLLGSPRDHGRQVVGRYLAARLLGVQVHVMLPAWLSGDSTR